MRALALRVSSISPASTRFPHSGQNFFFLRTSHLVCQSISYLIAHNSYSYSTCSAFLLLSSPIPSAPVLHPRRRERGVRAAAAGPQLRARRPNKKKKKNHNSKNANNTNNTNNNCSSNNNSNGNLQASGSRGSPRRPRPTAAAARSIPAGRAQSRGAAGRRARQAQSRGAPSLPPGGGGLAGRPRAAAPRSGGPAGTAGPPGPPAPTALSPARAELSRTRSISEAPKKNVEDPRKNASNSRDDIRMEGVAKRSREKRSCGQAAGPGVPPVSITGAFGEP